MATSSTAPGRRGMPAISGYATAKLPLSAICGSPARNDTIDAHGMVVAPGFIDMLGQSEMTMLVDPHLPSKIYQGITTEITGEGGSIAPLNDAIVRRIAPHTSTTRSSQTGRTFRQYFARIEKQGMGINLASYVGATQVRRMVIGDDDRPADTRAN